MRMQSHTRSGVRKKFSQKPKVRAAPETVSYLPLSVRQMRQRSTSGIANPAHRILAPRMKTFRADAASVRSAYALSPGKKTVITQSGAVPHRDFAELRYSSQCAQADLPGIEISPRGVRSVSAPHYFQRRTVRIYRPVSSRSICREHIQSSLIADIGSHRENEGVVELVVVELAVYAGSSVSVCRELVAFVPPCSISQRRWPRGDPSWQCSLPQAAVSIQPISAVAGSLGCHSFLCLDEFVARQSRSLSIPIFEAVSTGCVLEHRKIVDAGRSAFRLVVAVSYAAITASRMRISRGCGCSVAMRRNTERR